MVALGGTADHIRKMYSIKVKTLKAHHTEDRGSRILCEGYPYLSQHRTLLPANPTYILHSRYASALEAEYVPLEVPVTGFSSGWDRADFRGKA
jgi:hypothetical protein